MVEISDVALNDAVWVDAERMGGVACFRDTRVPVEFLFDWLSQGETIEYFLAQYPTVKREFASAALAWAKFAICKESGALETFTR